MWLYAFVDVWFYVRKNTNFFRMLWDDLTYFNRNLKVNLQRPKFRLNDLKGIAIRIFLLGIVIGSFKLLIYIIK